MTHSCRLSRAQQALCRTVLTFVMFFLGVSKAPSDFLSILILLSFISRGLCFNALLISIGHAGHVTPLFELAKALKNHNIIFLTQPLAQSYIDVQSYPNSSSFRIIYTNDSADALIADKHKEQQLITYSAEHSFFDGIVQNSELLREDVTALFTKTVHILMTNQFDVIIANSLINGVHVLCKQTNSSCVIQSTEALPNMLDLNIPNIFSLLPKERMTQIKYRIYNVIYSLRLATIFIIKILPSLGGMMNSFPRIPGPFHDTFSMKNMLFTESRCLELISMPATFYPPSYPHHYKKHLGAFIDETTVKDEGNDLNEWVKSKPNASILYGAFGTSSLIKFDRMRTLIGGLVEFLSKSTDTYLLLVLRGSNYKIYQKVLNEMKNDEVVRILGDRQRVKFRNEFVQQKWILQQTSVRLFLSHCGMGSCSEGIYYQKPILCMPFNMDQFINAMTIDHTGVGLSLFVPPSLFQSLISPYHFHNYTFSSESVTVKLVELWVNGNYQRMVKIVSLEMKHAGGLKRAVEEIEFLVSLNGSLDRYAPFQSTLPFYQRYMLDLIIIFVVVPITIVVYAFNKCCRRRRKEKKE